MRYPIATFFAICAAATATVGTSAAAAQTPEVTLAIVVDYMAPPADLNGLAKISEHEESGRLVRSAEERFDPIAGAAAAAASIITKAIAPRICFFIGVYP